MLIRPLIVVAVVLGAVANGHAEPPGDSGVARFEKWKEHFGVAPDKPALAQLEAWLKDHPRDAKAAWLLAVAYASPEFNGDVKKSYQVLKRYEDSDEPRIWAALGGYYLSGELGESEVQHGLQLTNKAMKANCPNAFHNMGIAYLKGVGGLTPDLNKARELMEMAGKLGAAGEWYTLYGLELKTTADPKKVVEFLKKGAEQGDPRAQFELANLYLDGKLLEKSREDALQWLRKSAESDVMPLSQFTLSELLRTTEGADREKLSNARHWCLKAAEHHYVKAESKLASAYLSGGYDLDFDAEQGFRWMHRAAEDGDADAKGFLGLAHMAGLWVRRDEKIGRRYLTEAANGGIATAAMFKRILEESDKKGREESRP
jgi:TPR repeat protein